MLFKNHSLLRPLKIVIPSMKWDLFQRSLLRYSGDKYRIKKDNFLLDLLLSMARIPLIVLHLIFKSRWSARSDDGADILLECGDRSYYDIFFKKIESFLSDLKCWKSGQGLGMDCPVISNTFSIYEAVPVAIMLVIFLPYLLVISLFYRTNFVWALAKTCVVYYRTSYYFKRYPCRLFLTYADNKCSPAFYSAFKRAGGEVLCAFQNGIRFADEGIDYSYFDHLFPIGRASVETYKKAGSIIHRFTEVGALALGSYPQMIDYNADNEFDVMFIDQGYPTPGMNFWGFAGSADVEIFLKFIRQFALERTDLRLVYQLRGYGSDVNTQKKKFQEWFLGTTVVVLDGETPLKSYSTIMKSKVIVTMCSTLGLAALAMGRLTLFFNFNGCEYYNVVSGKLQSTCNSYSNFKDKIDSTLSGKISLKDLDINCYISDNTFNAPQILASSIKQELKGSR